MNKSGEKKVVIGGVNDFSYFWTLCSRTFLEKSENIVSLLFIKQ